MRNQDRIGQITPGATMKLLLFGVVVLICLLFVIGLVAVGAPILINILSNAVELIEIPASSL